MRGDMVVDGSITAAKIVAGQIAAIHVGTNLLIANSANIGDLLVKNIHIANAQITVANFGSHGGGAITGAGGITLDVPITIFGIGGSTVILTVNGGFDLRGDGASSSVLWTCSLVETGATMDGGQAVADNGAWIKVAVGGGTTITASGSGNNLTARLTIQQSSNNSVTANVRLSFVAFLR